MIEEIESPVFRNSQFRSEESEVVLEPRECQCVQSNLTMKYKGVVHVSRDS